MRCWHVRKNDPFKNWHVYNLFFKIPYGALERLIFIKRLERFIIKTPSRLSKKKKRSKPKNPNRISRSKFRLTLTCDSSLQLHIHTDWNSVFQPIRQMKKENPKGSKKKKKMKTENLYSFSATVKTKNLYSSSATTGDLEAIPSLLFNSFWLYIFTLQIFMDQFGAASQQECYHLLFPFRNI